MRHISSKLFKKHIIHQAIFPEPDKERWLAYLILKEIYPNLTYWSWDGYSCDALVDYSINLLWKNDQLIDNNSKAVIDFVGDFFNLTTEEIVSIWMLYNGATEKVKLKYLEDLK